MITRLYMCYLVSKCENVIKERERERDTFDCCTTDDRTVNNNEDEERSKEKRTRVRERMRETDVAISTRVKVDFCTLCVRICLRPESVPKPLDSEHVSHVSVVSVKHRC